MERYPITSFKNDSTKVLACRDGDIFTWIQDASGWNVKPNYHVADVWQMKDGDQVLVTNRLDDVPQEYPLHPTMVGGISNVNKMLNKLKAGYTSYENGIDLSDMPEVWKLKVGDYLIWTGVNRPDVFSHDGILGLWEFQTGSLAIIQNHRHGLELFDEMAPISSGRMQEVKEAFEYIEKMGRKRHHSDEWKLG